MVERQAVNRTGSRIQTNAAAGLKLRKVCRISCVLRLISPKTKVAGLLGAAATFLLLSLSQETNKERVKDRELKSEDQIAQERDSLNRPASYVI
jgi:hypothetical protein